LEDSLRRRDGKVTRESAENAKTVVDSGDVGLMLIDESDGNENRSYAPSRGSELDDGAVSKVLKDEDSKFVHADESSNLGLVASTFG
jgi:hypothetical protein